MAQETTGFNIAIPIYEGVDLMDVAAPCEMFSWMGVYWTERAVTIELVEAEGRVVKTRDGVKLTPDNRSTIVTKLIFRLSYCGCQAAHLIA